MIRKSGLFIFLGMLSVVVALSYLFAGVAIRSGLISSLESVAGAEVNIAKVSLNLSPLSLDIDDVQITDKYQPELNLLSFKNAHADLEVWPALMGYYVIDELSIVGLSHNSQRKSPGKVYQSAKDDTKSEESISSNLSSALQIDLPSAEELLARVNLETISTGEELLAESKKQQKAIQELESKLPQKQTLLDLQGEIKTLTAGKVKDAADLSKKTEQLKDLRKQVNQESNNIKEVKVQLSQSREKLSSALAKVNEAKNKDWQKLQSLANIKDGGLASISQLLLGETWAKRITQLKSYYDMVKPYIPESKKEENVKPEKQLVNRILPLPNKPYPDFWIKLAKIDWLAGGGVIDIRLKDVTTEHVLINAPTQFQFNAKGLPKFDELDIKGDFAIRTQMTTNMNWTLDKYTLEPSSVGGNDSLLFSEALLDSKGSIELVNTTLEQKAEFMLNSAKFSSSKNKTMEKLAATLNKQSSIPLTVKASGDFSNPSVSIRSNLDSIIGDAVLAEAKQKAKELETKLREQLNQKVKEQLNGQQGWLDKLDSQDKITDELQTIIEDSLKAELQDVKGQAKDALKEKALKFGAKK